MSAQGDGGRSEEALSDALPPDSSQRTWNYRVIRFDHGDEVEFAIHEVHYRGDQPIAYSARPATLAWFDTDEPGAPQRLLHRLAECISKPVLTVEEIRSDEDEDMRDWDSMPAIGAERFWEPAHSRLPFKKRLEFKQLIDLKRLRKQRRLE